MFQRTVDKTVALIKKMDKIAILNHKVVATGAELNNLLQSCSQGT